MINKEKFLSDVSGGTPEALCLDQLKKETEKYYEDIRGLFYIIPIPVCITDQDGYFEDVNTPYCELCGYFREELIGQHFTIVVPDGAKEQMARFHDDFIRLKREFSGQWDVVKKSGEIRTVVSNAAYVEEHPHKKPLKITFVLDITNRQQVENDLRTSIDILNARLEAQDIAKRIMIHDLKNPIGNILNIVEMLSSRPLGEKDGKWISLIGEVTKQMDRIVQSQTDLSKMETGNYIMKRQCVLLRDLLNEVIQRLRRMAERRHIQFQPSINGAPIEEAPIELKVDQFHIEQMLYNLMINALEASPDQARIIISAETTTDTKISVTNSGVIPKDIRGNLFNKHMTSGKRSGQGLGTYHAQLIAKQHGGTITFETSDTENKTTFTIHLPNSVCQPAQEMVVSEDR